MSRGQLPQARHRQRQNCRGWGLRRRKPSHSHGASGAGPRLRLPQVPSPHIPSGYTHENTHLLPPRIQHAGVPNPHRLTHGLVRRPILLQTRRRPKPLRLPLLAKPQGLPPAHNHRRIRPSQRRRRDICRMPKTTRRRGSRHPLHRRHTRLHKPLPNTRRRQNSRIPNSRRNNTQIRRRITNRPHN